MKKFNKIVAQILVIAFIATSVLGNYSSVFAAGDVEVSQSSKTAAYPGSVLAKKNIESLITRLSQGTNSVPTVNNSGNTNVTQKPVLNVGNSITQVKQENNLSKINLEAAKVKETKEILVKYKDAARAENVKKTVKSNLKLSKLDLKKRSLKSRVELLEIDQKDDINKVLEELKKDQDVLYAQPNYKLFTNALPGDEKFSEQWGLLNDGQAILGQVGTAGVDIDAVEAWDITKGSPNVLVGVLDTGIDISHADLKDNIYKNLNEIPNNGVDDDNNGYIDDYNGFDFINNDSTVFDSSSSDTHGTHVAGIIAADDNSKGVVGVAPNVKIMPLKFINGNYGYTSDAIEGIEYAKAMGIKILNCSWGGPDYNPALMDAMQNSDILYVCAAGNSGANVSSTPIYPACFELPNIISVSALDNMGMLASFSNYGDKVNIAAPGVNILSTLPGGTYGNYSGTSMAAPFVSGTAALLKSSKPAKTANEMKANIEQSVTVMGSLAQKTKSSGMLNAKRALTENGATPFPTPLPTVTPTPKPEPTKVPQSSKDNNLPFQFLCNLSEGSKISTKVKVLDSALPFLKVQLIISEENKKEAVFDGYIEGDKRELRIDSLKPDTNYQFNLKIDRGNVIDSYVGTLKLTLGHDKATQSITDAKVVLKNVLKNTFNSTYTVNQVLYFKAPLQTSTVQGSVYGKVYAGQEPVKQIEIKGKNTTYTIGTQAIQYEDEPNYSPILADLIYSGDDAYGRIGNSSDVDYFKISFNTTGLANFWLGSIPSGTDYDIYVYDDGILSDPYIDPLASSEKAGNQDELIKFVPVDPNKFYYIKIKGYGGTYDDDILSNYHLRVVNYVPDMYETNNTPQTATSINLTDTRYGTIHYSIDEYFSDIDFYAIQINQKSNLNLSLSIPGDVDFDLGVIDVNNNIIDVSDNSQGQAENLSIVLDPGTYYIIVFPYISSQGSANYSNENYCLQVSSQQVIEPYASQIVSDTIPAEMEAGKSYQVSVTVRNTGSNVWSSADLYSLGGVDDSDPFASARQGLASEETIGYDQTKTFTFTMTAPCNEGTYTTDWRMVRDSYCWFGETLTKQVNVVPVPGNLDNNYPLTWPTTSNQVTLRYGAIDNIYSGWHRGVDIQGNSGDSIYSAVNGQVVYAGYQEGYGNVVYIKANYNGKKIQTKYGHLQEGSIQVSTGSVISAGTLIGRMGSTGVTNGRSLLHFEVLESNDGNECRVDGANSANKDPLLYTRTENITANSFLSSPFAIGNVPGDTFVFRGTSVLSASTVTSSVYSAVYTSDTINILSDPDDPHWRYVENADLVWGEAYLRKLVERYVCDRDGVSRDDLDDEGILVWDETNRTATVRLNGKYPIVYGESLGNAVMKNNRLVINEEDFMSYFFPNEQIIITKQLLESILNNYPGYGVILKNSYGSYDAVLDGNFDTAVMEFLNWYKEYHPGNYLEATYQNLPQDYRIRALVHWVGMVSQNFSTIQFVSNLLPRGYYENMPNVPMYDTNLGSITNENKYLSSTAKEYYVRYYYPVDALNEVYWNSPYHDTKTKCFELWARFTYGSSQTEQDSEFAAGILAGLAVAPLKTGVDTAEGLYILIAERGYEQLPAVATFLAKATVDEEYRQALIMLIDQAVAEWQTAYGNADPYYKGGIIGSLAGEVLLAGLEGVGTAAEIKNFIKSGRYLTILKVAVEAVNRIKSAMRASADELGNLITKFYSKADDFVEVEYAGVGRMRFQESELLEGADIIGQQRYKNFLEAKWVESPDGMSLIDDAAETLIDGQQYTTNGRIKVLKSNVSYTSNGYTYQTDSLGRVKNAGGRLQLSEAPRNDYAQRVAGRIDRRSTDQGGHLIASRFNGSGNLDNLVPMDGNLNQGAWKTMENTWADALANGKTVDVNIEAVYSGVSQRPTEFIVEYYIDGTRFEQVFENIAGGGL